MVNNKRMWNVQLQSDWEIVERGWKAHVLGEAEHTFKDALEAVKTLKVPHLQFLLSHLPRSRCVTSPGAS